MSAEGLPGAGCPGHSWPLAASPGEDLTGPFPRAARAARVFAVVMVCLIAADRVTYNIAFGPRAELAYTAASFVLPVACAVPWAWPLVSRYRWLVLAVQAVLAVGPFVLFGAQWQPGLVGVLAGLVLLLVPGRPAWLLAGGLLAGELTVRAVLGDPWGPEPAWCTVLIYLLHFVGDAVMFFGPLRLARVVEEVDQARDRLADLAVAAERLEVARSLQREIGDRAAGVAALAAAARRELAASPQRARAQLAQAGRALREMTAQAKALTAVPAGLGQVPAGGAQPGAVLGARLVWIVMLAVLAAFGTNDVAANALFSHYDAGLIAVTAADDVLAGAAQIYHSRAAIYGARPRAWPVTLAAQGMLAYAFIAFGWHPLGSVGAVFASSVLLLVPGRWRWAGYAAVVASLSVLLNVFPAERTVMFPVAVCFVAAELCTVTLLVYGLTWLAAEVRRLEGLREELARLAVVRERVRVARDVHDLLGLGLAAAGLKADLAGRLIGRDDAHAAAQIDALRVLCAATRSDIRLVTEQGELSLAAELAADRDILASAGITVEVRLPGEACPEAAGAVLAPVLREAVTNVLRHSHARACLIEAGLAGPGRVVLRVRNDGAPGEHGQATGGSDKRAGRGLANCAARVQLAGGQLGHTCAGGWFTVTAEVPLAGQAVYSQPDSAATRTASIRLRAPSLVTAEAR